MVYEPIDCRVPGHTVRARRRRDEAERVYLLRAKPLNPFRGFRVFVLYVSWLSARNLTTKMREKRHEICETRLKPVLTTSRSSLGLSFIHIFQIIPIIRIIRIDILIR